LRAGAPPHGAGEEGSEEREKREKEGTQTVEPIHRCTTVNSCLRHYFRRRKRGNRRKRTRKRARKTRRSGGIVAMIAVVTAVSPKSGEKGVEKKYANNSRRDE
jgi:hypothetical protein